MIDRMECTSYDAFCAKYGTGPTHYGWCAGYIARKLYQPRIVAEVVSVDLELDIIQYREFNMVPVEVVGTFSVPSAPPASPSLIIEHLDIKVADLQARLNTLEAWARGTTKQGPDYKTLYPAIPPYGDLRNVAWNKPTPSVDSK